MTADPSALRGRRVLVTGASGFLGHAVCARLLDAGAKVHGSWRTRPVPPAVIGHPAVFPRDARALLGRVSPEIVIHLASPIRLARDPALYDELRAGILDTTAAIAALCLDWRIPLIHIGTCDEYGEGDAPYSEQTPAHPISPYGALKLAATEWVSSLSRARGLRATVLRPFRAYGPGDTTGLVAQACQAALHRRPFPMTDGSQVREWNAVEAIAEGVVRAAATPAVEGRLLNLGGGPRLAVLELVQRIFTLADADPALIHPGELPRRAGEPDRFWGDHGAARAALGPLPHGDLDVGLSRCLTWHRDRIAQQRLGRWENTP